MPITLLGRDPPRQTVNQICRVLEPAGMVRRGTGPVGKIVNGITILARGRTVGQAREGGQAFYLCSLTWVFPLSVERFSLERGACDGRDALVAAFVLQVRKHRMRASTGELLRG